MVDSIKSSNILGERVAQACALAQRSCPKLVLRNDLPDRMEEMPPSERYFVQRPAAEPISLLRADELAQQRAHAAIQGLGIPALVGVFTGLAAVGSKAAGVGAWVVSSVAAACAAAVVIGVLGLTLVRFAVIPFIKELPVIFAARREVGSLRAARHHLAAADESWRVESVLPPVVCNHAKSVGLLARAAEQQAREPHRRIDVPQPRSFPTELRSLKNVRESRRLGDFDIGVSSLQGRRSYMEDRVSLTTFAHGTMVTVLDGHGGEAVAELGKQLVPEIVAEHLERLTPEERRQPDVVRRAIKDAFDIKDGCYETHGSRRVQSAVFAHLSTRYIGSTVVMAVRMEGRTYLVNLGDSRGLAVAPFGRAIRLTHDHKPEEPRERRRVEKFGLSVDPVKPGDVPRIKGRLAVSRGIGNVDLRILIGRRPGVTCLESHGPIVLATDGLFDLGLSDAAVGKHVFESAAAGLPNAAALGALADRLTAAAWRAGSGDNITAVVLRPVG